jgi:hypothetical protein
MNPFGNPYRQILNDYAAKVGDLGAVTRSSADKRGQLIVHKGKQIKFPALVPSSAYRKLVANFVSSPVNKSPFEDH